MNKSAIRLTASIVIAGISIAANAQKVTIPGAPVTNSNASPDVVRPILASIFGDIAQQEDFSFHSTGTIQVGTNQPIPYADSLSVSIRNDNNGKPRAFVELYQTFNGQLLRRAVGDGDVLWDYDATSNQYRSYQYGDIKSSTGIQKLFGTLRARTTGALQMQLQLVNHALLARITTPDTESANWQPVISTAVAQLDAEDQLIEVSVGGSNPIYMTYSYNVVNGTVDVLKSMSYQSTQTVGGVLQTTRWNSSFTGGQSASGANYSFNPGNAKLIPANVRQGGGWS